MWRKIAVMFLLIAFCYCEGDNVHDNEIVVGDARASKKNKKALRLWAIILLVVFSKIAVFKFASFMFFFMIFQKLFYFAGILLNFFMRQKMETPAAPPGHPGLPGPPAMYGPPADYNTIGYSYGPPENNNVENFPGSEYGLPSLTDLGGSFNNWLFNKNT